MMKTERLQSLDVLRGMDMFMILCGGWSPLIFLCEALGLSNCWLIQQCHHAAWGAGVTIIDLIFPTFLFISGVTFPYSLARQREQARPTGAIVRKILTRVVLLFALGLMYNHVLDFDWAHHAIWSVIGRIGLAWGAAALVWVAWGRRGAIISAVLVLLGWWLLCRFVPSPDAPAGADAMALSKNCIAPWIDAHYLTLTHTHEGAFATLAMVPTALLGMLTGDFLRSSSKSGLHKVLTLSVAGVTLIVLSLVWEVLPYGMPRNKPCWSSSYVLYAGGISALALALVYWLVDVRGWQRAFYFFKIIGLNPLTIYMLSATVLGWNFEKAYFFGGLLRLFPGPLMNCCAEWGMVFLFWLLLLWMHKHKLYLKV